MEELLINGFSDCTAGSSAKICRLIGMTGILAPAVSAICAAHAPANLLLFWLSGSFLKPI
jgi:hypothetical protein